MVTKVENFFVAAPRTYRLSGLYLIDAICKSKASAQNDFPKLFANRLGAHMAMLLDGASEKEQVRFSGLLSAHLLTLFRYFNPLRNILTLLSLYYSCLNALITVKRSLQRN